ARCVWWKGREVRRPPVVTGSRDQTERTDTPSPCESVQANLPLVKLSGNHRHLDAYAKPGRGSKSNSLADSLCALRVFAVRFGLRFSAKALRARQEIRCAFWRERRAGRCEAPRRRRCRCASSRSGNKADARPPPRPSGLRPAGPLAVLLAPYIPHRSHRVCSSLAPCQQAWGPAAKCTPYFLTGPNLGHGRDGHATKRRSMAFDETIFEEITGQPKSVQLGSG